MLKKFKNILIILIVFTGNNAYSLSSSSYLIANTAINLLDFEKANEHFSLFDIELDESDLHNKLLIFVNLNLIGEASKIANKIIKIDDLSQEAWLVYLTEAKITNNLKIFKKYKQQKKQNIELIDYIFYSNNGSLKNDIEIAKAIFEIVQASVYENKNNVDYKFLLFYLSIANIIDPNFNEGYFYSAQIYSALKNFDKADIFYNKVKRNHRLFIESQISIASNNNKRGLFEKSEQHLKKLINIYKENVELSVALANLYRMKKKYAEAISHYTNIINLKNSLFDDHWRIFYLRGICYERLNQWNLAEKDFLYSLKINPNSSQVLNYLAYGWLERDIKIDTAFEMLNKAYQAEPKSYHILDSLAWAYFKKNKLKKAAELMEEVIKMAPGESISLDHLADIYLSLNRKREALYFWRQALDLAESEDQIIDRLKKKLETNYE